MTDWLIYRGTGEPHGGADALPPPPPWRTFDGAPARAVPQAPGPDSSDGPWRGKLGDLRIASSYRPDPEAVELVNAALYLRRPLLVTGKPGTGKSSLAYAVAHELRLGPVLRWPITSRSTLGDGLYSLRRASAASRTRTRAARTAPPTCRHRPTTSGSARSAPRCCPCRRPRVLLIDEIDKSDIDLPNDLLNVFEEGEFEIPELARIADRAPDVKVLTEDDGDRVTVHGGQVRCKAFPFVVLTSNGEREFPPALPAPLPAA